MDPCRPHGGRENILPRLGQRENRFGVGVNTRTNIRKQVWRGGSHAMGITRSFVKHAAACQERPTDNRYNNHPTKLHTRIYLIANNSVMSR